jgi:predicted alpha/beta superfamily hydrolase
MKTFNSATIIALFLLLCTNGIQAQTSQKQPNKVCLDNTEQFSITSKYVEGETYVIQVGLPVNYSNSQKSYPVLYVLDGDYEFGMAKEIAEHLIIGNDIKDIFVVGISYGQGMDAWWNKRARDLSPSKDTIWAVGKQFTNAGGADNFLKFIQYELFPVVNKNYRINPDSVAIFGHSFGGLFTSYILFKQPELFKGYIISSPPVIWNNKSLLKLEAEYFSNHKELNNIVYLSIGSLENWNNNEFINLLNELSQNIQAHNYKGMTLVTRIFEGETHTSVPSSALNHGMRTLFKP